MVVMRSCAEWYASQVSSYAEVRRKVRITDRSYAEFAPSATYYIWYVTPSCDEVVRIKIAITRSYAGWYTS